METVDIVVVGAGLSGIGLAGHLRRRHPERSLVLVEARGAVGGTWDRFRYPGVRSDSDMTTYGYADRPWTGEADLASGPAIRAYLRDTVEAWGLTPHLRLGHAVKTLAWSSDRRRWTVEGTTSDGEPFALDAGFVVTATGYYDLRRGHVPDFPGVEAFEGQLVHPQDWPEGLPIDGRRFVVIGSGATAVSLVPALAERASSVVLLQRTPTWIFSRPAVDPVRRALLSALPGAVAHPLVRWKNLALGQFMVWRSRRDPDGVARFLTDRVERALGGAVPVDPHFAPPYDPWEQRLCLVPDDDLFVALREGRAEIVTDTIETFTETGVRLASGRQLDAEVVVSATGLVLRFLGGITATVDGRLLEPSRLVSYRGVMFADVPNAIAVTGYTRASWTLKVDLVGGWLARVFDHMQATGADVVVPHGPGAVPTEQTMMSSLAGAGYVRRGRDQLPRQGASVPWRNRDEVVRDTVDLGWRRVDDGVLRFLAPDSPLPAPVEAP